MFKTGIALSATVMMFVGVAIAAHAPSGKAKAASRKPAQAPQAPATEQRLVVEGGKGSGTFMSKSKVTVSADVPAGKFFDKWIVEGEAAKKINRVDRSSISFNMPPADVTMKATFGDIAQSKIIRVACVGDSITEFGWPKELQALLGKDYDVRNFGMSSTTTLFKGPLPYHDQPVFKAAKDFKPDIVIVLLGTNDTRRGNGPKSQGTYGFIDDFVPNYTQIVTELQEVESKPKVYAGKPTPMYGEGNWGLNEENLQAGVIPGIEKAAQNLKLPVIDFHAALSDKPELFKDRVHPGGDGPELIAATAYKALTGKDVPLAVKKSGTKAAEKPKTDKPKLPKADKPAAKNDKDKTVDGYECVISGGSAEWGSRGVRPKGEKFTVKATAPGKDMAFAQWVGNIEFLAAPQAAETKLTMPADFPFHNVHIAASYKRVALRRFVHALFQDHMVIQRGVEAPVWGWTEPGKEVTVELAGQTAKTTAGADGKWLARIGPLEAGGPHTLKISGPQTRVINNVLVGDVWLCSGQSNMAGSGPAKEDTEKANLPNIRLFADNPGANEYDGAEPFDDIVEAKTGWVTCSPETASHWSRVAFYFGRSIHDHNKVPLGLIVSAMDGSFIEGWMSRETLMTLPEYVADGRFKANYNLSWGGGQMPFVRYNARIAPLGPYALKGVLWYQGESNGSLQCALRYRDLLTLMIRDWRQVLEQGKLPFVIVQMHMFGKLDTKREPGSNRVPWAELEESQLAVARSVPNVGCAVTVDLAREQSLHPPDKKRIGERAAVVARKVAYGEDVVCYGPLYKAMAGEGDKIRLSFESLGGGLVAQGGAPLKYFTIAGADRKFFWADARIDGDTVVVSSPKVKSPVAVRYGWGSGQQEANLFNQAGLPASLFRSDEWSEDVKGK